MKRIAVIVLALLLLACLAISVGAERECCEGCTVGTFAGLEACLKDGNLHICDKNFPDPIFRQYVQNNLRRTGSDVFTEVEAGRIQGIFCYEQGISSLQGVGYFASIQILNCRDNQLTELDVTNCPMLTNLSCGGNQLTELDVSKNPQLTRLYCAYNQLTALDVTNCPMLTNLLCGGNQISELHVENLTELELLSCYYCKISSLDVSRNTKLRELVCQSNQMTKLDVSMLPELISLSCGNKALVEVKVNNPKMQHLDCSFGAITDLDISMMYDLVYLSVWNCKLTGELDLSDRVNLETLNCNSNQLTSLKLQGCTSLTELECGYNQLTELDISDCDKLQSLYCGGNQLTELNVSHCNDLEVLFYGENKLTGMVQIAHPEKILGLDCSNCQLTEMDLSGYTSLLMLRCERNELISVQVPNPEKLIVLECGGNGIKELDVSQYPNLKWLYCQANRLATLDLSMMSTITEFGPYGQYLEQRCVLEEIDEERYINLAPLVGEENLGRIVRVTNQSGTKLAYDSTTGLVSLGRHGRIEVLFYEYNVCAENCPVGAETTQTMLVRVDVFCEHRWPPVGCTVTKLCEICHKIEYALPGHTWSEGGCMEIKTCLVCGEAEKEPHGHKWNVASCTSQRTCLLCGFEQEAQGDHKWQDATCKTPKTCADCGVTEGEPTGHKHGPWTIDKTPKDGNPGLRHRNCRWCGCEMDREEFGNNASNLTDQTDTLDNDYGGKLDHEEDVLELLLLSGDEWKDLAYGGSAIVALQVNDFGVEITEEEQRLIAQKLGENNVAMYLDIVLSKQMGTDEAQRVTELDNAVSITITVPAEMRALLGEEHTFKIMRIHEGEVVYLDAKYDPATGELTFMTDAFSTYALVHDGTVPEVTVPDGEQGGGEPAAEFPGWAIAVIVVAAVAVAAAVTVICLRKKK